MTSVTDDSAAADSGAPAKRRRSLTLSLRLAILIAVLLVASAAITTIAVFRSVGTQVLARLSGVRKRTHEGHPHRPLHTATSPRLSAHHARR